MNSPLLHGGRKRKRLWGRLAIVAIVIAPLAVGGAAYLTFARENRNGGGRSAPVAVGTPPTPRVQGAARGSSPLHRAEPAPKVPLSGVDSFRVRFHKAPRAALLFDVRTGEVLWRRQPLKRLPMASLTKIMTALVVTDRAGPRERVRIDRPTLRYQGSGIGVLPRGRRVRLETLLNGLLIVSGNDAAIALADHVAGTQRRFVRLMNRRARRLGLRCTRFVDAHGLDPRNRSCARDLAVMTRLAMANRRIARIARRRNARFRFPIKGGRLFLNGHNPLMRLGYRGAIGLKTGYTGEAGRCFVGVARRRGRTLGVVLLDSSNPGKHAAKLLNRGFRTRRI
jgi:serine-type D-Ala-D-Ala carboxypeptidase (penicillin-binding protein 5/6)